MPPTRIDGKWEFVYDPACANCDWLVVFDELPSRCERLACPKERHPHYHLGRGYFPWFVHDVPKPGASVDKSKAVSAVCSSKQMRHTKHHARFRLAGELARAVPGFDWYGKGVKPLERKEDELVPYKYHVAIENHIAPHHWSNRPAARFSPRPPTCSLRHASTPAGRCGGTARPLDEYEADFPLRRIHQANRGLSEARNAAMAVAS